MLVELLLRRLLLRLAHIRAVPEAHIDEFGVLSEPAKLAPERNDGTDLPLKVVVTAKPNPLPTINDDCYSCIRTVLKIAWVQTSDAWQ
jgi:hypothetical protein